MRNYEKGNAVIGLVRLITVSIVLITSVLFTADTNAQSNSYAPVVIPASPTAAELGKYGSWPVDYYHGLPQINIPLYDLKVGDLHLPISLSYHASGIKVDQEASWVGLGWSLNAGGVITRQLKGSDDFNGNYVDVKTFDDINNGIYPTAEEVDHIAQKDYYTGLAWYDAQPDIFNYNFAGYSGQFMLERLGANDFEVHFIGNHDGLTIIDKNYELTESGGIFSSGTTVSFKIIDKSGFVYYFESSENLYIGRFRHLFVKNEYGSTMNELSMDISGNPLAQFFFRSQYVSSWYLTKIESPNSDDYIEFHYTPSTYLSVGGYSGTLYYNEDDLPLIWYATPLASSFNENELDWEYHHSSSTLLFHNASMAKTQVLSSITTSRGISIDFIVNHERLDVINVLDYDKTSSNTNALSQIIIFSDNEHIKSWDFTYDYFYSGITTTDVGFVNSTALDNRLKLKALKQVSPDGLLKSNPFIFSYYGEVDGVPKMPYRNCVVGKDFYGYLNMNGNNITVEEAKNTLNLFPNLNGMVWNVNRSVDPSNWTVTLSECDDIELVPEAQVNGYSLDHAFAFYSGSMDKQYDFNEGSNFTPDGQFAITYSLKDITYPTGGNTEFIYELNMYSRTASTLEESDVVERYGGGLRIKEMKNYIPEENQTYETTFDYNLSGVITNEQEWTSLWDNAMPVGDIFGPNVSVALYTSPVENSIQVGYSEVTEISPQGKTVFKYTTPFYYPPGSTENFEAVYESKYFGAYNGSAYIPGCSPTFEALNLIGPVYPYMDGWQEKPFYTGKLLEKKIYKNDNEILHGLYNKYDFVDGNYIYSMEANYDFGDANSRVNITRIPTGKCFLTEQKEINYVHNSDGSIKELEKTTTYSYDFDKELLKETLTEANDYYEPERKTILQYESDITNPLSAFTTTEVLDAMEDKGMKSEILIKTDYVNSVKVDEEIISYDFYNIDQLHPSEIRNLEGELYSVKFNFDDYDNYGNPIQFHAENDINFNFLWGYNNRYPVAKIINAQKDEYGYTGFENSDLHGWNIYYAPRLIYVSDAHTGDFVNEISTTYGSQYGAGKDFFRENLELKSGYKASVWAKGPLTASLRISINNSTDGLRSRTASINSNNGDWQLLEVEIPYSVIEILKSEINYIRVDISNNNQEIAYFDDLRFHPLDAEMETYTYDPLIGMTSANNANNITTFYNYDKLGRLITVKNDNKEYIRTNDYNYVGTTHEFTPLGGTINIDINSEATWEANCTDDWLTFTPSQGSNNGNITIDCPSYSEVEERNTWLTISGEDINRTIQLTQTGAISLTPSSLWFSKTPYTPKYINISVTTGTWTANEVEGWMSIIADYQNNIIIVECTDNPDGSPERTGTILIEDSYNNVISVLVTQQEGHP